MKPGQPVRLKKGNLAIVNVEKTRKGLPEILAVWNTPPSGDGTKVIGFLNKNDIILITEIWNINQHTQYSKVLLSSRKVIGWVNSKFLKRVQK